jgi:hypothetical protein
LGLATKSRKVLTIQKPDLRALIDKFLHLRVRIRRSGNEFVECPLGYAGKHLAQSYLVATTYVGYSQELEKWWIRSGMPLLFLECGSDDQVSIPYFARQVNLPSFHNVVLYHCLVPFNGGTVRMWFLDKNAYGFRDLGAEELEAARNLRIYLFRLHAEHECLRLILRNIMARNLTLVSRSQQSDKLQSYFNEATKRIGLLERKTAGQFADEISEIARESMNLLNPGQLDALERVLGQIDLRMNILRKVETYAKQWRNLTIIENVEENHMGDVFKDINQSIIATRGSIAEGVISLRNSGNEGVAQAISELDKLIAEASDDSLPSEKKQECADLLKGITDETKKQQPNKNILRSLGNGLLSIITTIEPLAKAGKAAFDVIKALWS